MRRARALAAAALLVAGLGGCGGPDGLALASQGVPVVRVALGRPSAAVTLRVAGRFDVSDPDGDFRASGTDLAAVVAAGDDGLVFQGRPTRADVLRVRPEGAVTVEGVFPAAPASRSYLGTLTIHRSGRTLAVVNELDLETYVVGVIGNEMAPDASPAAYRAQAVAARTYAYVNATAAAAGGPPLRDTESSQVYRGLYVPPEVGASLDDLRRRVLETRGVVLTWRSRPFPSYYASTCGGHTTEAATSRLDPGGATEPLSGVPCRFCAGTKYSSWTAVVTEARLLEGLKARGVGAPIEAIAVSRRGRGDWAADVAMMHGKGRATKVMSGNDFRVAAGLRSSRILKIEKVEGGWQVTGAGWGHGVGMCQMGAAEMARRGMSEKDILAYYYPGAEFTRLY